MEIPDSSSRLGREFEEIGHRKMPVVGSRVPKGPEDVLWELRAVDKVVQVSKEARVSDDICADGAILFEDVFP